MKAFTTLTLLAAPLLAVAAPTWDDKHWSEKDSAHPAEEDYHKGNSWLPNGPFDFTSTYSAYATPDQVVNANSTPTPGEDGAYGWFEYGINAPQEIICYNITVYISGNYSSPAATATHIHEAAWGKNGPPRVAFPNPTSDSPIDEFGRRVSVGCLKGPFTTGLAPNGTDTGEGFSLTQIEANPPGFFTDVHTANFTAGAIRGQLELTGSSYSK